MSFGEDEEILQDFLVEAGEILEQLSEQLVLLEQTPDDVDLLNAIFRGFHTIKGGAGFLQLNALVDCCHVTENLFDILRNGKRGVTPELMDVVLQALDAINIMFEQVQSKEEVTSADATLIQSLEALVNGDDLKVEETTASAPKENTGIQQSDVPDNTELFDAPNNTELFDAPNNTELFDTPNNTELFDTPSPSMNAGISNDKSSGLVGGINSNEPHQRSVSEIAQEASLSSDEISDDEFEKLLDTIHGEGQHGSELPTSASSVAVTSTESSSDEITEAEFESLLDQLHGSSAAEVSEQLLAVQPPASTVQSTVAVTNSSSETITDDEFDSLLDQLHGSGKGPNGGGSASIQQLAAKKESNAAPPSISKPALKSTSTENSEKKSTAEKPKHASTKAGAEKVKLAVGGKAAPKGGKAVSATVAGETTVRVDTQRLDDIMNMVGELVLVRNRLVRLGSSTGDEEMSKAVSNLDVVTADLQTSVMKTRMQPIKKVFGRFPRVVRDLARNLKKEINLELEGEETDLDKNLVEALADPLVHLVRNSVDHGIEMPAEREAAGKSRVGKVILSAEQEGDHILLSISDDGAGMDPSRLRDIAVDKGLMDRDSADRLSDSECYNLIFMPGFSSKEEVSDISGRGVGMDVVKTKITQLNGSIEITSKLGSGSKIAIKVPLTLAIMPTLMVMLGDQTFALPLVSVNEIFHMDLTHTNVVDGQEIVIVREKALPLFHLKRWLVKGIGSNAASAASAHVVIVSVGTQRVGFVVDSLIGQEEVVIKPLGKMLHGTPGMAGATITGDGRIALILDVPSMLKCYAG